MTDTANSGLLKLILASGSKYRRQQLEQLQLPFESMAPEIDESPRLTESAAELAARLAASKGRAVLKRCQPPLIIIASDQTASCGDLILGKPGSEAKAVAQLSACSGRTVVFHTALWLSDGSKTALTDVIDTRVNFRPLTEQQIRTYIKKEQVLDCAGSFKCEGLGISLFESIHSDDPSALIGLPLIRLTTFLKHLGINII